jgi:hypothetical protein
MMKWVVGLLLVANALLFAYFKLSQLPEGAEVTIQQPLHPEKIKVLTSQDVAHLETEAAPESSDDGDAAPEKVVTYACYEWGNFSAENLPKARNVLTKFALEYTVKQETPTEAVRYWVYIPPLPSVQAAQSKIEELKALGVTESFILQEPQWRNAISLGVFKDEQLAAKLLEELKGRGVRSAIKGARNSGKSQASLIVQHVSNDMVAELDKLKPDFAGSELKPVTCQ